MTNKTIIARLIATTTLTLITAPPTATIATPTITLHSRVSLPNFLHKPSTFTPNAGRDNALDMYINVINRELMTFTPKKTFPNLRNEEKKALKELRNNKDVTIKPADKGGAVVVLNTTDYVSKCTRQLSDTSYYDRLDSDPTNKFNKIISDTLTKGKQDREID